MLIDYQAVMLDFFSKLSFGKVAYALNNLQVDDYLIHYYSGDDESKLWHCTEGCDSVISEGRKIPCEAKYQIHHIPSPFCK